MVDDGWWLMLKNATVDTFRLDESESAIDIREKVRWVAVARARAE